MKLLLSAITLFTSTLFCMCALSADVSAQRPAATPTPVYRPAATPPIYQPKTAPAPSGTPATKPPVYSSAGPKVAKLTKASLVGTWVGTVTQGLNKPVANGFRFILTGSELSGFWLDGSKEMPIASKDMSFTETMFTVRIVGEDYTITFTGYILEDTGDLKGATFIETLGQKSTGVWSAKRQAKPTPEALKQLVDQGQRLMAAKDYEGAIKLFNQVLENDKGYVDAYRFRGLSALLMYEAGPREGQLLYTALFNFDDVIKGSSVEADDYYLRGMTYERLGSKQKAIADYRAALNLYSNHQGAKDALKKLGITP